jgi:hypothetical protein
MSAPEGTKERLGARWASARRRVRGPSAPSSRRSPLPALALAARQRSSAPAPGTIPAQTLRLAQSLRPAMVDAHGGEGVVVRVPYKRRQDVCATRDGGQKARRMMANPRAGKASSDIPAFKPHRGKPAVRNFRGGDGDVGIIRSPVRAIALPDRCGGRSAMPVPTATPFSLPNFSHC